MIPIVLSHYEKHLTTIALLDSGSDITIIPLEVAEYLGLPLGKKEYEGKGVGTIVKTVITNVNITITDGKNTVCLRNAPVDVYIPQTKEDGFNEIIIGRMPVFREFEITFKENQKRVEMVKIRI